MGCEYAYFTFPDCGCPALVPLRFCPHHVDPKNPNYKQSDKVAHMTAMMNPARIHMLFKSPCQHLVYQDYIWMMHKYRDPLLRKELAAYRLDDNKRKAFRYFGKEIRRMQIPEQTFGGDGSIKGLESQPTVGFHTKLCTYHIVYPDCQFLEIWHAPDDMFPFLETSCMAHDNSIRADNSKRGWGVYSQAVPEFFEDSYEEKYNAEKDIRNKEASKRKPGKQAERDDFSDFSDNESYYIEKISLDQSTVDKAAQAVKEDAKKNAEKSTAKVKFALDEKNTKKKATAKKKEISVKEATKIRPKGKGKGAKGRDEEYRPSDGEDSSDAAVGGKSEPKSIQEATKVRPKGKGKIGKGKIGKWKIGKGIDGEYRPSDGEDSSDTAAGEEKTEPKPKKKPEAKEVEPKPEAKPKPTKKKRNGESDGSWHGSNASDDSMEDELNPKAVRHKVGDVVNAASKEDSAVGKSKAPAEESTTEPKRPKEDEKKGERKTIPTIDLSERPSPEEELDDPEREAAYTDPNEYPDLADTDRDRETTTTPSVTPSEPETSDPEYSASSGSPASEDGKRKTRNAGKKYVKKVDLRSTAGNELGYETDSETEFASSYINKRYQKVPGKIGRNLLMEKMGDISPEEYSESEDELVEILEED